MSNEMESRRSSSGIIARLMGLEVPSSHAARKQHMEMGNVQNKSTIWLHEKHETDKVSVRTSYDEHHEFKDVYEVTEMSKVEKHKNQKSSKGISHSKQNKIGTALTSQKFMSAKQLPHDGAFENRSGFRDALREPNSLFPERKCDPPPRQVSDITILKSSKDIKCETSEVYWTSERISERNSHILRNAITSYKKSATIYGCQSLKEHSCYLPDKLSESRSTRKSDVHHDPTGFIIRPDLEKIHNVETIVPSARSCVSYQLGKNGTAKSVRAGHQNMYSERKDWQSLSNEDATGSMAKSSREIAREITKEVRQTESTAGRKAPVSKFTGYSMDEVACVGSGMSHLNNGELTNQARQTERTAGRKAQISKSSAYNMDESSFVGSGMSSRNNAQVVRWTANELYDRGNSFNASSPYSSKISVNRISRRRMSSLASYSTESSVNREARRRLSEQWKLSHGLEETGLLSRRSSTLGEMLALSESEIPKMADPLVTRGFSNKESVKVEPLVRRGSRFGINSKGSRLNRSSTNLPMPLSYRDLSTDYSKPCSGKGNSVNRTNDFCIFKDIPNMNLNDSLNGKPFPEQSSYVGSFKYHNIEPQFYHVGGAYMLTEREIQVNSEKLKNRVHMNDLTDVKTAIPELSEDGHHVNIGDISVHESVKLPSIANKRLPKQPTTLATLAKDDGVASFKQRNIKASVEQPQLDILHPHCKLSEFGSPISSNEASHQSPISVLEPPSEEDNCSSGCFDGVSADLQELRTKLQLLKFDSADEHAEEFDHLLISSDEETGEYQSEMIQALKGEDRDFSYILDILIESGVHSSYWNMFCLAEFPVGEGVFYKLEKKYRLLASWSKTERKLLFDLVNATLIDTVLPDINMHMHSRVNPRKLIFDRVDFVDELWQMVVRQRTESSISDPVENLSESRWLSMGNDMDSIGREIASVLKDDLLEEFVSELILKQTLQ